MALGKTVGELQDTLSPEELDSWREFFIRWPFDDYHRFHRPAALVSASLSGGDLKDRLDWLQPPPDPSPNAEIDFWSLQSR